MESLDSTWKKPGVFLLAGVVLAVGPGCSDGPVAGQPGSGGTASGGGGGGMVGAGATGAVSGSGGLGGNSGGPLPAEGSFVDPRDGQTYALVTIGTQTWMAENLRFETPGSQCYGGNAAACETDGRMYTRDDALAGAPPSDAVPSGVQGVCPVGWHLPSDPEWEVLASFVASETPGAEKDGKGNWTLIGARLKATSGWGEDKNGTDEYGFQARPAGFIYDTLVPEQRTSLARWQTASQRTGDSTTVRFRTVDGFGDSLLRGSWYKEFFHTVRCVRDE